MYMIYQHNVKSKQPARAWSGALPPLDLHIQSGEHLPSSAPAMTMSLWSTPTCLPLVPFYNQTNQTKAPSQSLEHSPASALAPPRFDPHIGFVALSRSSAPSEWWAHGLVSPLGSLATRKGWVESAGTHQRKVSCQGSQYVHPHIPPGVPPLPGKRLCNYKCTLLRFTKWIKDHLGDILIYLCAKICRIYWRRHHYMIPYVQSIPL